MQGGGGGGGGGSSAAGGGGSVLGAAAREPREEKERGGGGGGAMGRASVRARVRAPHGAGALLVVGGAIVGAAVVAWCRRHRDGRKGAKNHGEQHAKEEDVLDSGVLEDDQGEAQKLHQIYENLSRDNIEIPLGFFQDGKATQEIHQIQKDDEIVPAELVSEPVEKYDHKSDRDCAEITADGMVIESVTEDDEKYDHNSDRDCAETTADGMVTESVTEDDENSSKNDIEEDDENSSKNSVEEDDKNSNENDLEEDVENSSKNGVENEIIVNDTEGAENSGDNTLSLSSPDIAVEEHDNHNGVAQDTEPTETTPTTETVTHQEQLSVEVKMDTVAKTAEVKLAGDAVAETAEVKLARDAVAETADVKLAERTVMEKNEFEQKEAKTKGELVEPIGLPAYSSVPSLIKRTEKKSLVNPGWNERGMKLEQDCTNCELKEHELTKRGAVLTMDRRTTSVAILVLMFALIIGITIFIRLSVPLQAT